MKKNMSSISDIARQLEKGSIKTGTLNKAILRKCAVFFKSRGYSNEDIAEILGVCSRTIERYVKKVRSENSLKLGVNFQRELLGDTLNNIRLCYQRLLRLSYSYNLSDYEKARTIFMCHQVEMNGITLLNQLGYISKEQGIEEINFIKEEAKEANKLLCESIKTQAKN